MSVGPSAAQIPAVGGSGMTAPLDVARICPPRAATSGVWHSGHASGQGPRLGSDNRRASHFSNDTGSGVRRGAQSKTSDRADAETPSARMHRAVMFCSIAAEGYQLDRDREARLRRGSDRSGTNILRFLQVPAHWCEEDEDCDMPGDRLTSPEAAKESAERDSGCDA